MLPLVFQSYQINLLFISIFYGIFILTAHKLNVQRLYLVQMGHATIRFGIISTVSIWIYGFSGWQISLVFLLLAGFLSTGLAYFQTRRKLDVHKIIFSIPICLAILLMVFTFEGGSKLYDWTIFHGSCPTVSANELPQRTEQAFVVSDAQIMRNMRGHHQWQTTDSDGNTKTHDAYYGPLVDRNWTKAEPVPAWVDLQRRDIEWVGRIVREPASADEWMAVVNAQLRFGLSGGSRAQTFRVVESDAVLIQEVSDNRGRQLIVLALVVLMSSGSLFWVRYEGVTSRKTENETVLDD